MQFKIKRQTRELPKSIRRSSRLRKLGKSIPEDGVD
jgi:hypothetical protein